MARRIGYDELRQARHRLSADMFVYIMACIQASGMTQLEIAQKLDWPLSELRRVLLSHHKNWSLDFISDLCWAIGVELDFELFQKPPTSERGS